MTQRALAGTVSRFSLCCLLLFRGFRGKLEPDFRHDLGIHQLPLLYQIVKVIKMGFIYGYYSLAIGRLFKCESLSCFVPGKQLPTRLCKSIEKT